MKRTLEFPLILDTENNLLVWNCLACEHLNDISEDVYGGPWLICDHHTRGGRSNLRSFPFKTPQDCCRPDIFRTSFAELLDYPQLRWPASYLHDVIMGFRWANPQHPWPGLYNPDWYVAVWPECYSFWSLRPVMNCGECEQSRWCERNPWREHA